MSVASQSAPDAGRAGDSHRQFKAAQSWENSRVEMIERSERRAWWMAKLLGAGFLIAAAGAAAMLVYTIYREPTPFLVRENTTTGGTDLITVLDDKTVGYDEVRDKYFLGLFVTARESYQWYTIQKDYDTVRLMSAESVGKVYASLFEGEKSLDKVYGSKVDVTVKILSIVPADRKDGIGTVRFVKTTARTDDPNSRESRTYVATIGYTYRNAARLRESSRLVNPFGFTVVSYRADPESAGGGQ